MKLIKCHIENFGKLSDFTYDFTDGCNTVCEENGWGKSTLAAFLRVMLFGFRNEGKRDPLENERKRYSPLLRTASMPKSGIWRRIRTISIILRQRTSG